MPAHCSPLVASQYARAQDVSLGRAQFRVEYIRQHTQELVEMAQAWGLVLTVTRPPAPVSSSGERLVAINVVPEKSSGNA
jgi:hypothetical protein